MSQIVIPRGRFFEGSAIRFMGLVVGLDGQALTRSQITSWDVVVTSAGDGTKYSSLGNTTLDGTGGSMYFAAGAPETGSGWTADSTGFNWRHDFDTSVLSPSGGAGGVGYSFEYTFHAGDITAGGHGRVPAKFFLSCVALESI